VLDNKHIQKKKQSVGKNTKDIRRVLLWQLLDQCPIAALISKSQEQIFSGEHELCNSQENLTKNYNSILPLFISSPHGLCYDYTSTVHPTLKSMCHS